MAGEMDSAAGRFVTVTLCAGFILRWTCNTQPCQAAEAVGGL